MVTSEDAKGNKEAKLVIEVRLVESYKESIRDARLWLGGVQSVRMIILVKFHESPIYRNPIRNLSKEIERLESTHVSTLKTSDFTMQGDNGPTVYKGFTWAGRLSQAFVEIWKRNSETGQAKKCGHRMADVLPNDL